MAKDEEIVKLSDFEHARLRTEMYLGSRDPHTASILLYDGDGTPYLDEVTYIPALYTAIREILDNALDEIAHGYGNQIDVTYDERSGVFSIMDNGRGIPFNMDKETGLHKATLALSHARAGRNFGDRGEIAGTNGIGASIVNFCSEHFKVEIWRDGKKFEQHFREGTSELEIEKPSIKKMGSTRTGTKITFKLSDKVFKKKALPMDFIESRILEISICNPLIKVFFNGQQMKSKPNLEKTLFPRENLISIDINQPGFKSKFLLKPNFQESGEFVHSVVNNIPAFNGGIHIETFKRLFYNGILEALKAQSKKRKLTPNRTDINDGLLIFNITNMVAPNFDAQSKTRLINEEAGKHVKDALEELDLYKKIIQKHTTWVDEIYARCSARTKKKENAEANKLARKNLRNKVPDLMDATGTDRTKCILTLAEGNSAIAGITSIRDPEIHGGLGLRGKVLNVYEESPKAVLTSAVLVDIMNSIGLIIGEKADIKKLRYGKVYIAHDMDPDGYNIGGLLVNFFYKFWPELFQNEDQPFFFIFNTPFIIAEKGKQRKYWFGHNYHEFDSNEYKGWTITRAKGLGTLSDEDWAHSLKNPDLFPLVDDGQLAESLELIFRKDFADKRKLWIGL